MRRERNSREEIDDDDRPSEQTGRSPYVNATQHTTPDPASDYHELNPVTIGVPQGHVYSSLDNKALSGDVFEGEH